MANRERGEIRLRVGGRTFTLRLTAGSCCEAEDLAGKDLDAFGAGVNAGSVTDLRWLLWAALQPKHGDHFQTVDSVGDLIDEVGSPRAALAVLIQLLEANADDRPETDRRGETSRHKPARGWRQVYLDARTLGVTPEQFWALSLREIWREVAVASQRRRADLTNAWWTAALMRQKKLPDLKDLIADAPEGERTQTWQSMKAALQAMSATQQQKKGATTRGHR